MRHKDDRRAQHGLHRPSPTNLLSVQALNQAVKEVGGQFFMAEMCGIVATMVALARSAGSQKL